MTTVAIVEDHPIFRQGLSHAIEAAAEPVEISGVYRSLEDFLAHAPARIDIVLLDLHLPGIGGAEGVRAVRERGHHVLVVSVSDSPDTVVAAIAAGTAGYLTKDADASEIIRAVSVITAEGTYVSPTLASHLLAVERRAAPRPCSCRTESARSWPWLQPGNGTRTSPSNYSSASPRCAPTSTASETRLAAAAAPT